jgi:hypothetical protein
MLTPYCEVIPALGHVQLTLDLVNEGDRQRPIRVELARTQVAEESERVLQVPARTYGTGLIELSSKLEQTGTYELKLKFDPERAGDDIVSIPFRVESQQRNWSTFLGEALLCVVLCAVGFVGWRFHRRRASTSARASKSSLVEGASIDHD